jgi:hypothetical protein
MRALVVGLVLSGLLAAPALACGSAVKGSAHIPPVAVAVELDELLPKAQLSEADLAKIKDLRAQITTLAAARKIVQARAVEEDAMRMLGYRKGLMRCGPGTYVWMKLG